ncbi:unnamed protein product [Callosobruchus maculatus]|uniref:CN hydrolase domain-containing protein n=1 Tax=Callosobruchus maculatus TaxID=64391 RepID=A0A653BV02_CALMS|nr:unnamed protein product [Callosobruchus maculatus]
MHLNRLLLILFLFLTGTFCNSDYYDAAVVEVQFPFHSITNEEEMLKLTIQEYIRVISSIQTNLDIIVFPESALGESYPTAVPAPFTHLLCNSTSPKYKDYLKELSCAALKKKTAVVVNLREVVDCKDPPPDEHCTRHGKKLDNTDVVFDHNGHVAARYRKWNLFGENYKTKSITRSPEVVTFRTKNNDTFGIFTCFDILFEVPTLNLTRNAHVKNVVFPNHWFSQLPYLTALQAQHMWAQENDVLLTAGTNAPKTGSGGTGIFLGHKGALDQIMLPSLSGSKLLLHKVPRMNASAYTTFNNIASDEDIDALAAEMDNFTLQRDPVLDEQNSVQLNTKKSTVTEEICHGKSVKTCCRFKVNFTVNSTALPPGKKAYTYHMGVFNGEVSPWTRKAGIESCAIMACLTDDPMSCGKRFPKYSDIVWPITFNSIEVLGNFTNVEDKIQYPNSLLASLRSISPMKTSWTKEVQDDVVLRTHSLVQPQSRILTFGIYGRDFSRDGPPPSYSAASLNTIVSVLVIVILISAVELFQIY